MMTESAGTAHGVVERSKKGGGGGGGGKRVWKRNFDLQKVWGSFCGSRFVSIWDPQKIGFPT